MGIREDALPLTQPIANLKLYYVVTVLETDARTLEFHNPFLAETYILPVLLGAHSLYHVIA